MRSRPETEDDVWMFAPRSESTVVTSLSSHDLSSASTWIQTKNDPDCSGAQLTSIIRSGCSSSEPMLAQSERWTDTPRPTVTNPMMSSPGTEEQHLAMRTSMSSRPSTTMPGAGRSRRAGGATSRSRSSSVASGAGDIRRFNRPTTVLALTLPSPTDRYS